MAPPVEPDVSAAERRARWGLGAPLLGLLLGLVGASVGAGVAAATTGAELTEPTLGATIGSLAGMWLVYAAVIAVTLRRSGSTDARTDLGLRGSRPRDVAVGGAAGLLSSLVVVNLVYLVLQVLSVLDRSDVDRLDDPAERLGDLATGRGFVLLALFVGLGAPVIEEVFFRGFLQPAAVRRFGAPLGIGLTALVFGGVHFQLLQFPALAAFGLVLGILAHRFDRIAPSIVAHVVFNGLTLAALALSG